MAKKFTVKEAEEVLPILRDIGKEDNLEVASKTRERHPIPDKLVDVLMQQLRPTLRTELAKRLIAIALGENDRMALDAIREIYDRVEGRARQATIAETQSNVIIVNTLKELFKDDKLLTASNTVDGAFKVLNEV